MSLLTKGVGQLIIDVVALTAIDADCNSSTAATVSWTDLGETYQLERSLNATTWSVIYTGTAFTKSETGLPNTDQIYYYRVKVLGEDVYSNIGYFQIYEQNKFLRDVGCYPAFNVSPYYFRKMYRLNCVENPIDTIDEETCKDTIINCSKRWDSFLNVPGPGSGSVSSHTLTISVADCDPSGSGTVGGVTLTSGGGLSPATAQSVTSATYGGGVATIQISVTNNHSDALAGWMSCSFSTLDPS